MSASNEISIMPSSEARLIKENIHTPKNIPAGDVAEWISVLLSINDDVLVVDDTVFATATGRDILNLSESLPSNLPLVVRRTNKVAGLVEEPILDWIAPKFLSFEGHASVHAKLGLLSIVEKYLAMVESEIDANVDSKSLYTHFLSVLIVALKCNEVTGAVVTKVIDTIQKKEKELLAKYPEVLAALTYTLLERVNALFDYSMTQFAIDLLIVLDEASQSNPAHVSTEIDKVDYYLAFDLYYNVFFRNEYHPRSLAELAEPLVVFIFKKSSSRNKIIESSNALMEMISPMSWLRILFAPIPISGSGKGVIFPMSKVINDKDCIARTVRCASTMTADERRTFVRGRVRNIQVSISETVSESEWRTLFKDMSVISNGALKYEPLLEDIFSINRKTEPHLMPVISDMGISCLFEIPKEEMFAEIEKEKVLLTDEKKNWLSNYFLAFLEKNVDCEGGMSVKDRIVKYVEFILPLKTQTRKVFAKSVISFMRKNAVDEFPLKRFENNISSVSIACFFISCFDQTPYDVMCLTKKESVQKYCLKKMI